MRTFNQGKASELCHFTAHTVNDDGCSHPAVNRAGKADWPGQRCNSFVAHEWEALTCSCN